MSTHLKDRVEKIQEIITKLTEEANKGKLIVVEGKKDAQALCELGVNGRVLTVKTCGKSFLEIIDEIERLAPIEVILLLDFDRRGKEGTKRLQQGLERAQIRANVALWRELIALAGRSIQCVEGLPSYVYNLTSKIAKSG